MKRTRKLCALLMAFLMVFAMAAPAAAKGPGESMLSIPNMAGKLVIIHTNDTHGHDMAGDGSLGTAAVSQLKKDYENAGADVLLLSAGDVSQGTALVNQSKGADAIDFMNLAGYDAMCPGNHEFDWGLANLLAILKPAKFPVLAANVVYADTGKLIFKDHVIFTTKSGLKVGVFGLDTPETATKTNPANVANVKFFQGQELYNCAQDQVNQLKAAGCDVVVALGHLGVAQETAATGNRSVDVVNHVTGIDLFIDGHSHTVMKDGKPVDPSIPFQNNSKTLIVSTGAYLANIGVVTYDPAAKTWTPSLVAYGSYNGEDPAVAQAIKARNDQVMEELGKPFAKTEVRLNGDRAPGNRTQETNLGDFAADALLWAAKKSLGEDKVVAAITNGGGIRDSIKPGEITMLDMKTVFPFGNTVATLTVTGRQLLEALEAATFCTPSAIGAFPQVSGITFDIDTKGVYQNGEAYGTYFKCANPGTRIKNVMVGGAPLDLNKNYTIATNDFTAAGGDTYYTFKDAYKANGWNTGVPMEEALVNYTKEVLGGVVTAAKYGQPAGRIREAAGIASTTPAISAGAVAPGSAYQVQPGDNLFQIAQRTYGDGKRWRAIYNMNKGKIKDPELIRPGMVLKLPAA